MSKPFQFSISRQPRSWLCIAVQHLAAVLSGPNAILIARHGGSVIIALTACFGASLLAIAFKWHWLVPCVVLGFMVGTFILDPAVKGGSIESQMRETCMNVALGTFVGLAIGIVADLLMSGRRVRQAKR